MSGGSCLPSTVLLFCRRKNPSSLSLPAQQSCSSPQTISVAPLAPLSQVHVCPVLGTSELDAVAWRGLTRAEQRLSTPSSTCCLRCR